MPEAYSEALGWCAAALCLKNMLNHLLVVRCRFAGELTAEFSDHKKESLPENWHVKILYPILYYAVGGFGGPFRGKEDMERFQAMERNAVENETFFLILAVIWPTLPIDMPKWAGTALLAFVYLRFVHFALYCFVKIQPWRAIAWTLATVVLNAMAINILISLGKNGGSGSGEL